MADEQYRWLNRDAAERLLRGEPLEAVDADTRARADRLADTLGALAAEVAPEPSRNPELPGEEAALAAFRTARTAGPAPAAHSGENGRAAEPGRTHTTAAPVADAGLVRLGRPVRPPAGPDGRRARWGRPVRFGLVAAVAAGMLGGVTAVVGGGGLSAFRGDEPEPSATLSAAQSPDRPLMSPSPNAEEDDGRRGAWREVTPDGSPDTSSNGGAPTGEGTGGTDEGGQSGDAGQDDEPAQEWWANVFSACRDVRDGKDLDAGRRRGLEDAAGGKGKGQLKQYCADVLAGGVGNPGKAKRPGTGTGTGKGTGTGASGSDGSAGSDDKSTRAGNDSDDDDDSDHRKGRNRPGNGHGKSRHGNGKGDGGKGHRGQLGAVTPIGFGAGANAAVGTAPTGPSLTHPS